MGLLDRESRSGIHNLESKVPKNRFGLYADFDGIWLKQTHLSFIHGRKVVPLEQEMI